VPALRGIDTSQGIKSVSIRNYAQNVASGVNEKKTGKKEKEPQLFIDPNWNENFSEKDLLECWKKYASLIERKNPRLHSILENHFPQYNGGDSFIVKLKNPTQEKELIEEKTRLFPFIKSELKNARIEMKIEYMTAEENKGENKAYTSADKFKLMLEKNPVLQKLKQQFGLDLE